ncbi:hypothetical protein AAF712_010205 [Marasmius tenuissimus]|uniref:DUF6532 domain-containing protein n=1 Tax=Marasmius tenuissimus TaxID=585030 RepID=A0ABR2ZNX0_9AGAR
MSSQTANSQPAKRNCKASQKASDPNNVASQNQKGKTPAKKAAKKIMTALGSLPYTQEGLQNIMNQIVAAGGLDAALAQGAAASTSATKKRKATGSSSLPSKKKARKTVVESDAEEDEDDDVLASIFGEEIQTLNGDKTRTRTDKDDEQAKEDEDDDDNGGLSGSDDDTDDEGNNPQAADEDGNRIPIVPEMENLEAAWNAMRDDIRATNGINQVNPSQVASQVPATPATPSRRSGSGPSSSSPLVPSFPAPPRLNRNGKVSHKINFNHFTPCTQQVLSATHPEVRRSVVLENAFPSVDKYTWVRELSEMAIAGVVDGNEALLATVQCVFADPALRKLFTQYCLYSRGGLLSTTTTKTRNSIAGHYGIPGDKDAKAISKTVAWLLQKGNFKMGSLDAEPETCNCQEPYQNLIFMTLIRTIFFSKGRADAAVFKALTVKQSIPRPVFVLLSTAIKHALTIWSGGAERKGEFGKSSKERYQFHLQGWNLLEEKAPMYTANLSKCLFRTVAEQTNKTFLLQEAIDKLDDVDVSGLESMAKCNEILNAPLGGAPAIPANATADPAAPAAAGPAADPAAGPAAAV